MNTAHLGVLYFLSGVAGGKLGAGNSRSIRLSYVSIVSEDISRRQVVRESEGKNRKAIAEIRKISHLGQEIRAKNDFLLEYAHCLYSLPLEKSRNY